MALYFNQGQLQSISAILFNSIVSNDMQVITGMPELTRAQPAPLQGWAEMFEQLNINTEFQIYF